MKIWFLSVVFAVLASTTLFAQARFEIVGGFERSYGRVPLKPIIDTLTITNPGTTPLRIIGMNPTCGCTVAFLDTNLVPPGGASHVYLKIDPPDVMGKIHKTIVFLTNDLTRPQQDVGFGFEILREIGASAISFAFAGCKIKTPCTCAVNLINTSDHPISVYRQPIVVPGLRSMMPDTLTIAPRDTVPYTLQWTPDQTGYHTGRFQLKTSSTINPLLEFNVVANIANEEGLVPFPTR